MNKTELIARIAEVSKLTKKDSELALNSTLSTIQETMISSTSDKGFNEPLHRNRSKRSSKKGKTKKNWEWLDGNIKRNSKNIE